MDKLIINHGDRVTEHELHDAPLVIGRDPECDLFFADKKLSRHHARIERTVHGVRLVDLGSRNGSWVNQERVEERTVEPGDEIRLGGLRISIERLAEEEESSDESTVYLGAAQSDVPPESGTIVLAPDPAPIPGNDPHTAGGPPPPFADSRTVFLSGSPPPPQDDSDETMRKPEPERTVAFASQAPPSLFDTGTVLFRSRPDPEIQEALAATRLAHRPPAEPAPALERGEPAPQEDEPFERSLTASVTYVPAPPSGATRSWTLRFSMLAAVLGAFSILVLGLPQLWILSTAIVEESELRGRALVDLLAAANEEPLSGGRIQDVSIERVVGEPGVTAAYVLSPAGEILAPRDRAGQRLELEGISGGAEDVRSLRSGDASDGDHVLAQPIMRQGRRVGIAVLRHRPGAASLLAGMVFLMGAVLVLMAVVVAVLLAKRMTVNPLNDLRLDIEAVDAGRAASVPADQPFVELSDLVASLNRLLASRDLSRGDEPPRRDRPSPRH